MLIWDVCHLKLLFPLSKTFHHNFTFRWSNHQTLHRNLELELMIQSYLNIYSWTRFQANILSTRDSDRFFLLLLLFIIWFTHEINVGCSRCHTATCVSPFRFFSVFALRFPPSFKLRRAFLYMPTEQWFTCHIPFQVKGVYRLSLLLQVLFTVLSVESRPIHWLNLPPVCADTSLRFSRSSSFVAWWSPTEQYEGSHRALCKYTH